MRECSGCKFCCWSFNVHDIPDEVRGLELKPAFTHCQHECTAGCGLHNDVRQPTTCREFHCPYQTGEQIHRPDTFQSILEALGGNIGNYIPAIDETIPVDEAIALIQRTRSLPAFIINGGWERVILPLDRETDGTWKATEDMTTAWKR
jgi:hypothetical protein